MSFNTLDEATQKKLVKKLSKLKALSECRTGNANEAAVATSKMSRIMLEYQIEAFNVEEDANPNAPEEMSSKEFFNSKEVCLPKWQVTLLIGIAKVHCCEVYINQKKGKKIHWKVLGTDSDIKDVKMLWTFCVKEILHLVYTYGLNESVKDRNDYQLGAANGVVAKLKSEKAEVIKETGESVNCQALQLFAGKEEQLTALAVQHGLKYSKKKQQGRALDLTSYSRGYSDGRTLDMTRKLV